MIRSHVLNILAKNTFYLTSAFIGQKMISFVYFLIVAKMLPPERTGVYFLVTSLLMIFSVVADVGVTSVVVREIAKKPDSASQTIRSALGAKLPWMLIAVFLMLVTSRLLGYSVEIQFLVALGSVILILDSIHLLFYGVLRGFHTLQYESIGMFVSSLCTALFGSAMLLFFPSLVWLIAALMIGSAINVGLSLKQIVRQFGWISLVPLWNRQLIRTMLIAAVPFALAAIFVKVYSYIDTLIISKIFSAYTVGLYGVAYKITYAFQFVPMALIATIYPGFSALIHQERWSDLRELFDRGLWYMMIIVTPIVFGLWAVAPEVLVHIRPEYLGAVDVLRVLIFALFPLFLDFPIGSLLNAANRQITKTVIMGITMLVNIILNLIFIPLYGLMGAAFSAVMSFTFMLILGGFFVRKMIPNYRWIPSFILIGKIAFSGLVMFAVILFMKPAIGLAVIPVGAMVYALFLWITKVVRKEDYLLVRKMMRI